MAKLGDLLRGDCIIEDLHASDKVGVIREFAVLLRTAGRIRDVDELERVLVERESLGSTGIGDGVAIPHGKMAALRDMVLAFGRSIKGIDFGSLDKQPAHLFFLLVTPEEKPGDHLKTLARISRMLKNPDLRKNLMAASHRQELQRLICDEDLNYPPTQRLVAQHQ